MSPEEHGKNSEIANYYGDSRRQAFDKGVDATLESKKLADVKLKEWLQGVKQYMQNFINLEKGSEEDSEEVYIWYNNLPKPDQEILGKYRITDPEWIPLKVCHRGCCVYRLICDAPMMSPPTYWKPVCKPL